MCFYQVKWFWVEISLFDILFRISDIFSALPKLSQFFSALLHFSLSKIHVRIFRMESASGIRISESGSASETYPASPSQISVSWIGVTGHNLVRMVGMVRMVDGGWDCCDGRDLIRMVGRGCWDGLDGRDGRYGRDNRDGLAGSQSRLLPTPDRE